MVFDSGHEFELEWLKYRHQRMAGFPERLAAGPKGKGFPMFSHMASVRVAQALRKGSQVLLPAAEREHLRESGFPPQIAIPPRDAGGLVGFPSDCKFHRK